MSNAVRKRIKKKIEKPQKYEKHNAADLRINQIMKNVNIIAREQLLRTQFNESYENHLKSQYLKSQNLKSQNLKSQNLKSKNLKRQNSKRQNSKRQNLKSQNLQIKQLFSSNIRLPSQNMHSSPNLPLNQFVYSSPNYQHVYSSPNPPLLNQSLYSSSNLPFLRNQSGHLSSYYSFRNPPPAYLSSHYSFRNSSPACLSRNCFSYGVNHLPNINSVIKSTPPPYAKQSSQNVNLSQEQQSLSQNMKSSEKQLQSLSEEQQLLSQNMNSSEKQLQSLSEEQQLLSQNMNLSDKQLQLSSEGQQLLSQNMNLSEEQQLLSQNMNLSEEQQLLSQNMNSFEEQQSSFEEQQLSHMHIDNIQLPIKQRFKKINNNLQKEEPLQESTPIIKEEESVSVTKKEESLQESAPVTTMKYTCRRKGKVIKTMIIPYDSQLFCGTDIPINISIIKNDIDLSDDDPNDKFCINKRIKTINQMKFNISIFRQQLALQNENMKTAQNDLKICNKKYKNYIKKNKPDKKKREKIKEEKVRKKKRKETIIKELKLQKRTTMEKK